MVRTENEQQHQTSTSESNPRRLTASHDKAQLAPCMPDITASLEVLSRNERLHTHTGIHESIKSEIAHVMNSVHSDVKCLPIYT